MTQFVKNPTRYSNSGSGNILDIILCDDQLFIDILDHHPPLGTSDHFMVEFIMFFPEKGSNCSRSSNKNDRINLPVYDWSASNYDATTE